MSIVVEDIENFVESIIRYTMPLPQTLYLLHTLLYLATVKGFPAYFSKARFTSRDRQRFPSISLSEISDHAVTENGPFF